MKLRYLILFFLLTSCFTKGKDENEDQRTYAGKLIYDCTETLLLNHFRTLSLATNADLYISAETEEEKYRVEDSLFATEKIRYVDNVCTITSPLYHCQIYTEGQSLREVGSRWKMVMRYTYDENNDEIYWLECSAVEHWKISAESVRTVLRDTLYETLDLNIAIENEKYQFSGTGSYTNSPYNHVAYEIESPLTFKKKGYQFSSGRISMSVTTEKNREETTILCDLSELNNYMITNKITMKGVTEVWPW